MAEKNWALGENGAKVVDVSHEATHVASVAANLLVEREDLLWITSDAPQHVTLKLASPHPPLRYVGWHVWHDYLSNPKTVEMSSGESTENMVALLVCEAVPGAGTQVWKLPNAIPPNHLYVRVKILETFGQGPTYMNNIALFANDPGTRFQRNRATDSAAAKRQDGSSARMNMLLKELDEDIRALHPIKTVSPNKNMLLYVPQEPMAVYPCGNAVDDETSSPTMHDATERQPNNGVYRSPHYTVQKERLDGVPVAPNTQFAPAVDISRGFNERLCAVEQAVASLTQSMNHQREDLTMIKRLLLQQASERRRELEQRITAEQNSSAQQQQQQQLMRQQEKSHRVSRHQVSVDFPEDALRSFVESVVAPKLHRHTKRTEAQTMAKLDDFLKDIVEEITLAVDDRVRFHQQASLNRVGNLPDMASNLSQDRRAAEIMKAPPFYMKTGERSGEVDYRASVPPRPMTSSTATPPTGSVCSGQSKDALGVPVSIIRGGSLESDSTFVRRSGANYH